MERIDRLYFVSSERSSGRWRLSRHPYRPVRVATLVKPFAWSMLAAIDDRVPPWQWRAIGEVARQCLRSSRADPRETDVARSGCVRRPTRRRRARRSPFGDSVVATSRRDRAESTLASPCGRRPIGAQRLAPAHPTTRSKSDQREHAARSRCEPRIVGEKHDVALVSSSVPAQVANEAAERDGHRSGMCRAANSAVGARVDHDLRGERAAKRDHVELRELAVARGIAGGPSRLSDFIRAKYFGGSGCPASTVAHEIVFARSPGTPSSRVARSRASSTASRRALCRTPSRRRVPARPGDSPAANPSSAASERGGEPVGSIVPRDVRGALEQVGSADVSRRRRNRP